MDGHPNAIASYVATKLFSNSAAVNKSTSAPLRFAPSTTWFAIASVFPVPLQNTTATLLIIPLSFNYINQQQLIAESKHHFQIVAYRYAYTF